MAIYYKGNKVSPIKHETSYIEVPSGQEPPASIDSSTTVTVTRDLWEDLETAVKNRTGTYSTATFSARDMIEELNKNYNTVITTDVVCYPSDTLWVRPQGWPNLDSLNLTFSGTNDFIYMTYRTGHIDDFFACYIRTSSGTATIDFGHINNGTYIVDSTRTAGSTSGTTQYYYFNSAAGYNEGYTVIRISGKLTYFLLTDAASANGTPDERAFKALQQPLLERIAYVPNLIKFYDSSRYWGAYTLEREKIGNNTGAACTAMNSMYYWCWHLRDLDMSAFYTPKVTTLSETFRWCCSLTNLDVSHWDTSKLTTLYCTFYGCTCLHELDCSNWNTAALTGSALNATFYECRSLTHIAGLGNFQTTKVTNIASVFYGCRSLDNVNEVSSWDTKAVTILQSVFVYCLKLYNLDISNWNIANVTRTDSMFNSCYSLKNIKFPSGQTKNLTYINSMFCNCYALQNVDVSWLKMDGGTCLQVSNLFYNCRSLTEINIPSNWNFSALNNSNYSHYQMFLNCYSVKRITGITNWDFRSTTSQSGANMFNNCHSLEELDISGWKINSTSYANFFNGCYSLRQLNISGFDFSNCTNISYMFAYCYQLQQLTLPNTALNTAKITTMRDMFNGCYSLQSLTLNFSDVSKVTTIENMFYSCGGLKTLTINNLNLTACTTMASMLRYCYQLEELSWSGWTCGKLSGTQSTILAQCYNLKKITGFPPIKLNFSMAECYNLSVEQIVNIFNNLETVTTARTINLTTQNINRLSAAEKAIATNKGWTLAN